MRRYLTIRYAQRTRLKLVAGVALGLLFGAAGFSAYFNNERQFVPTGPVTSSLSPASPEAPAPGLAQSPGPRPMVTGEITVDSQTDSNALTVLAVRQNGKPGQPDISRAERRLIEDYARENDRALKWVLMDQARELGPALRSGRGDLIVGQYEGVRTDRPDQVLLTQPWAVSRQRVIGRRGAEPLGSLADLESGTIAARRDSTAWSLLRQHADNHPDVTLVAVPAHQSMSSMLRQVVLGRYDYAVAESGDLGEYLVRHSGLIVAFDLPGGTNRTWAVDPEAAELRQSLNRYLGREALSRSVADVRFEDLPGIAERDMLRVITYQNRANYYLDDNGELRGFEYELARQFAKRHGLRVDVVVAPSQQDMLRWLLEGRGDLIAASIPAAGVRESPRLSLSRPYNYAAPLIVGRKTETVLIDARDLKGRRIVLPEGSPYKRLLERYRQRGINVEIREAGAGVSMAEILHRVSEGIYDLTVIGSHRARSMLVSEPNTRVHFAVSEPLPHTWVMRAENSQLKTAVDKFISETYRSRDYNVLHARYFEHPVKPPQSGPSKEELLAVGGELSPYDETVREYADLFGFDWRLIVAQMYQESRFNPEAESSAGALGLMQILPSTANELGFSDLLKPEPAIHAGVQYLSKLYDRFDDELAFEDRTWFALAAYNAGFQRVQQAREKAEALGLDPDRWFDNVEMAMLSLTEHSDCRCGQPVVYVKEIRARYHNYVRLTRAAQYAASEHRRVSHDT